MSDNFHIAKKESPPRKAVRKAFKPTVGDLHLNGCVHVKGELVWNVVEVLEIIEPVRMKGGRIYGWIVKVRDLRGLNWAGQETYNTQVSLPIFKSPNYNGRRDVY